jgi:hypothetical protein
MSENMSEEAMNRSMEKTVELCESLISKKTGNQQVSE